MTEPNADRTRVWTEADQLRTVKAYFRLGSVRQVERQLGADQDVPRVSRSTVLDWLRDPGLEELRERARASVRSEMRDRALAVAHGAQVVQQQAVVRAKMALRHDDLRPGELAALLAAVTAAADSARAWLHDEGEGAP